MKLVILPELKCIAEALKSLKEKEIIRTKNLVGDLGEYYCKQLCNLTINKNVVETGFDAYDNDGNKVEIKTRRTPNGSGKVIFRSIEFEYCLFVELNEYFEPIEISKIAKSDITQNLDLKGDRLSISKLKSIKNRIKIYPI